MASGSVHIKCPTCQHYKTSHYSYARSGKYGCHAFNKDGTPSKCRCLNSREDVVREFNKRGKGK